MKEETIERLIDDLNQGKMKESVFRVGLSHKVEFAKAWLDEPKGGIVGESSYEFYLLLDDNAVIVGAVLDMGFDLHAFVKEAYRGRGIFSGALHDVILPHIREKHPEREVQRVTFLNPETTARYAARLGFTQTGDNCAVKPLSEVSTPPPRPFMGRSVTWDEFKQLRRRIDQARLHLIIAKEQLEMSCGSVPDELLSIIDDLNFMDNWIWDHIEETSGKLVNSHD